MAKQSNMKRIHKVTVKRMYDESPDTSWLGNMLPELRLSLVLIAHTIWIAHSKPSMSRLMQRTPFSTQWTI